MNAPSSDRLESLRVTLGRGASRPIGTAVPKVREVLPPGPADQDGTSRARKVASAAAVSAAPTTSSPASDPTATLSAGTFGVQPSGETFSSQPGKPSSCPNIPASSAQTTTSQASPASRGA